MVVLVEGFKLRGLTEPFFSAPQNGQILFISVEQLSLNVADDSAKTLSVLGNMGDFLDDCCLRFVQKCRRPPQNTPDLGGSKKDQKTISNFHGHVTLPKSF